MVIKNKLMNFLFVHLCGAYIIRALSKKIGKCAQKGTGQYLRICMLVLINITQNLKFQIINVVKLLAIIMKSKTKKSSRVYPWNPKNILIKS